NGGRHRFLLPRPGLHGVRPLDAAPLARTLRENGYATGVFGSGTRSRRTRSHPSDRSRTGRTREGFDTFYGIIARGRRSIPPETCTPAPRRWSRRRRRSRVITSPRTSSTRPGTGSGRCATWTRTAPGSPTCLSAPPTPPSRFPIVAGPVPREVRPGWDAQREQTLERQKELGRPARHAPVALARRRSALDELDDDGRVVAARLMEMYAAFAEHTDEQVGRLVEFLRDAGELENTVVFYFLGDNGASCEGRLTGTFNESRTYNGLPETAAEIRDRLDEIGGPTSYVNYPVGWALAMDTPFQWTQQVASHFGGTRNGLVVHWPKGISDRGGVRTQWHHVIDVAPTILEAAGIPHPDRVDGIAQRPIEGTSMLYALRDGAAPDRHLTQYFEIFGNRGIFHDGWTAVTSTVLRGTCREPTPSRSTRTRGSCTTSPVTSPKPPIWPPSTGTAGRAARAVPGAGTTTPGAAARRSRHRTHGRGRRRAPRPRPGGRVTVPAGTRRLPTAAFPSTSNTSFRLSVPVVADSAESDGVLVSLGNSFNGLSFYVREGVVTFAHNLCSLVTTHVRATESLAAGEHLLEYLFAYDGGGIGRGGTGRILVDGRIVGEGRVERTALFGSGRLTVGANPGTPVTSDYARDGEYRYTGRIGEVTLETEAAGGRPTDAQRLAAELVTH
ncbi:sulfatase-like hydrolase/transferase, partial [Rhodococcus hoagii]|nr:sulfatase-like hydrolase/transferase [Prescottella equi]